MDFQLLRAKRVLFDYHLRHITQNLFKKILLELAVVEINYK